MNRYCSIGRWKKAPEGSNASTNPLRVKTAQVSEFNGALERFMYWFKCERQPPTVCQNSAKCKEFNGALEEGSRRSKMRARTEPASLLKMLQPLKLADPP